MIETPAPAARRRKVVDILALEEDPLWYKDALIYEVHVRAFMDSDSDGSGDFRGLIEKLPYLQDLGVNAIWLLPFYPSPLRDDGYDISDYIDVHPAYGTLRDFQSFLKQAHRRNEEARALSWHRTTRTAENGGCPSVGDPLVCNWGNPIHAHPCASVLLT